MLHFPGRRISGYLQYCIGVEEYERLSKEGKQRLEWIKKKRQWDNVSKVCRYFGISRKTFYKWYRRYKIFGLMGLETPSKAPHKRRQVEITRDQELRIIKLRKQYIRYGPKKLAILYEREYGEKISSWKIYRLIRKYGLYWEPVKNEKLRKKRKMAEKKKRITELKEKEIEGLLFQMDSKVVWCYGTRRYILSAIEKQTKIAYSRVYKSNSSSNARDFLLRLYYLVRGGLKYLHTDNGSEFMKHFQDTCKELNLEHYFSKVRTPNDHPEIERYNRTRR